MRLVLLWVFLLTAAAQDAYDEFLQKVCPNALEDEDPLCLHGGTLYAQNLSDYLNCASCTCPDAWSGIDCGLCTSVESCPRRRFQLAKECTHNAIYMTDREHEVGKQMSCYCGGPDETTDWVCGQQPGTNWQIKIDPSDPSGTFNMSVIERAGIPSQDYYPPCGGYDLDVYACPSPARYEYAASEVWEAQLHECTWKRGTCTSPMTGDDCIVYDCAKIDLQCPPDYVEKCPGWTPGGCDNPPGEPLPYWMHHCNPITLPMHRRPIKLSCKPEKENDGLFQCYLSQDGAFISSVGMRCETGSCIYVNDTEFHHQDEEEAETWREWLEDREEGLVVGFVWVCLVLLLIIALVLIQRDKKRSRQRVEVWTNSAEDNATVVPLVNQSLGSVEDTAGDRPMILRFEDVDYYVRLRGGRIRHILRSVHGIAAPCEETHPGRKGSMLAIIGPSGAGKTSLLDILSGYRRVGVVGTVRVDGTVMSAGDRSMRRIAGYVQQDDVLPGTSTVFEYLLFNAALRMPNHVTRHQREERVFEVLQLLGLTKVAHSFVGDQFTRGLSGGEKRRVSIACELLVGPKLVFLDEPTTGLDSTNASKVVEILSEIASGGVAVVMSIHQPRPDLFRILDRTMLLSGYGQVVYSGPASKAESYFAGMNFVSPLRTIHVMDYMLDVVIKSSASSVDDMVQKFHNSGIKAAEDAYVRGLVWNEEDVPPLKFRSSFFKQVRCLSTRLMRNTSRHPFLIALNFAATLTVAIALGLFFYDTNRETDGIQSRIGVLFFILMFLSTMSLSSLPVWREERLLFRRERGNGVYGASAYFLSVLLFDLIPLRVLPPMFFSIITYWLIDLHGGCAHCIVWFTLIMVMTNVVAALTSMTIGAATPTNAVANALGSLVILVFLLFAGFFLNKDEMPRWCKVFSLVSYINYGYSALMINEFKDVPEEFVFTALIENDDFPPLRIRGEMILCEFGFDDNLFAFDVTMLFVIGGICCAVTYLILLISGWDLSPSLNIDKTRQQEEQTEKVDGAAIPIFGPKAHMISPSSLKSTTSSAFTGLGICENMNNNGHFAAEDGRQSHQVLFPGNGSLGITCVVSSTLLRSERTILRRIRGIAGPLPIVPTIQGASPLDVSRRSTLFAIMGPSGAGKTTLLDILAGRKRDIGVSGDIRINGRPATASMTRKLSGYVHQDNVLPGTPTVFEHVMFHAQLRIRLPKDARRSEEAILKERVMLVCQQLGLEKVLDSRIGDAHIRGLSGGERRRVSIACELLVGPGIMFLDEPTTGLDSTNATQVVDILSEMASAGVTVIMSIHQPRPSFFNLMDKIMMLSGDGQVVFTGCSSTAERHFESLGYSPGDSTVDISDFILDLVIKSDEETVQNIVNAYQTSEAHREDDLWIDRISTAGMNSEQDIAWSEFIHSQIKYQATHLKQIRVLFSRMKRNLYRHPLLLFVNFFSAIFVSLMLGAAYWDTGVNTAGIQNRMGSLFFTITYLSLMSLSSLPLWHDDRLLFVRERAAGAYGTTSYFVANVLFDILPMRVIPPCFFGAFSHWMIGYNASPVAVFRFLLVIILCNIAGSTFSLAIGAMLDSTSVANMVASLFLLIANLLGGFFLSRNRLFEGLSQLVDVASKLSYVRYAFDALMLNEFHEEEGFAFTASHRCLPEDADSTRVDATGDDILNTLGFPTSWNNFVVDIVALLLFILAHSTVTFLMFKFRDRPGEAPMWSRILHKLKQGLKALGSIFSNPLSNPAPRNDSAERTHRVPLLAQDPDAVLD